MTYRIGYVYRITKIDDPTINYIGSTFTTLRQRWRNHKKDGNCSISKYLDEYGRDQFKIILIKEYLVYAENQKDNRHLRAYEQLWINKFRFKKCCINENDALPLLKKEKARKWKQNNKEKIKQHLENNREQILERMKKYRETHKEQINEYQRKYREEKRKMKLL